MILSEEVVVLIMVEYAAAKTDGLYAVTVPLARHAVVIDSITVHLKRRCNVVKSRNWYTYEFKRGNKVLHKGITQDLDRRESEHQDTIDPRGHIRKIGRVKTEEGAREWEKEEGCS
jgi:hypothetical protein